MLFICNILHIQLAEERRLALEKANLEKLAEKEKRAEMVGNLKPLAKRMMKRNLDGAFSAASLAIFHFASFDQTLNSLCTFLEGN